MSIWLRISEALQALTSGEGLSAVFDRLRAPPERSVAFTIAVIALGAKMAKADGQVTRDEVTAFREVFQIAEEDSAGAAHVFNLARKDVAGFEEYASRIAQMFRDEPAMLADLMEGLFHIAMADGLYHPNEDAFLIRVAELFAMSEEDFANLRARFVPDMSPLPHVVLGIKADATLAQARAAWRDLVRANHPDALVARGLPAEAVAMAEKRMIDINRAWGNPVRQNHLMRIATYNVEWFASLFDDAGVLHDDDHRAGRFGVSRAAQTAALGVVFQALDADAVMVIEAPDQSKTDNTAQALEGFAQRFGLRANRVVMGFANDTQQEIALLYDPAQMTPQHDPRGEETGPEGLSGAPRFDGVLRIDLDIDATEDKVVFSKPPLELSVTTKGGFAFHMIGAHLKSKAPHGAKNDDQVMQISIANRRKQLAQAVWMRRRIEAHLEAGTAVMVLGDMNDGPGLDAFENLFGRSSVEIVLGHEGPAPLFDPHAKRALSQRMGAMPTTSRFWIRPEKRFLQALLDYIMVSPAFQAKAPQWRIWHPLDDPHCWNTPELRDALVVASDHFPVSLDFED